MGQLFLLAASHFSVWCWKSGETFKKIYCLYFPESHIFWFYLRLKKVCLARPSACEKLFFFNCDLWLEKWGLFHLNTHQETVTIHMTIAAIMAISKMTWKLLIKNTHTLRETNRASKLTTAAGLIAAAALLVLEQPHKLHLNIKEFQKSSQLVSFKQPTTVILRARRKVTPAPPTTCRQLFLELCSTMYKMCTVLRKMSFAHQHPRKVRFCRTPRIFSI